MARCQKREPRFPLPSSPFCLNLDVVANRFNLPNYQKANLVLKTNPQKNPKTNKKPKNFLAVQRITLICGMVKPVPESVQGKGEGKLENGKLGADFLTAVASYQTNISTLYLYSHYIIILGTTDDFKKPYKNNYACGTLNIFAQKQSKLKILSRNVGVRKQYLQFQSKCLLILTKLLKK